MMHSAVVVVDDGVGIPNFLIVKTTDVVFGLSYSSSFLFAAISIWGEMQEKSLTEFLG